MVRKITSSYSDPIQLNEIDINARNDDSQQNAYTNHGGFVPEEDETAKNVAAITADSTSADNNSAGTAPMLTTRRPVYNHQRFDKQYAYERPPKSPADGLRRTARRGWKSTRTLCSVPYFLRWLVLEHFPMIDWVRNYDVKTMLTKDVLSGITCGVMQVPQGMAYAVLAGVGPVPGLYTAFVPTIVYSVFASSRHVSVASFAVLAMLTANVIKPHTEQVKKLLLARATRGHYLLPGTAFVTAAAGAISNSSVVANTTTAATTLLRNASAAAPLLTIVDDEKFSYVAVMALATSTCLCCGIVLLAFGVLRLGFISSYLSDSLIAGFCCGAAVHIFTTQLFPALGLKSSNPSGLFMLYYSYKDLFGQIRNTNLYTMGLSIICIAFLYLVKTYINGNPRVMKRMYNIPIPAELIVVVIATILAYFCNFAGKLKIKPVGHIPVGLIAPTVPDVEIAGMIFAETLIIAFVIMALTMALGRVLAKKNNTPIDPSTELRALGLANLAGSFYQCIPAGCAMARTMVLASIGAPTQLTNFIGSFIVFLVVQFLGKLLEPLPSAVLAAIVIVAIKPLFMTITECWRLLHVSFVDASIYLVTLIAILLGEVGYGIVIGLGYSIFTVVIRTQYPHVYVLGRLSNTELYQPLGEYRACAEIAGIRILRIAAPVYFANVEFLRTRCLELVFNTDKYRALAMQKRSRRISQVQHSTANGGDGGAGKAERLRKIASAADEHSQANHNNPKGHINFGHSANDVTVVDLHGNSTDPNFIGKDPEQTSTIVISDRVPLTPKPDDIHPPKTPVSGRFRFSTATPPAIAEEDTSETADSRPGNNTTMSVRQRKNSRKTSTPGGILVNYHKASAADSQHDNNVNRIEQVSDLDSKSIAIGPHNHHHVHHRQPKLSVVGEVEQRQRRARPPRISVVFAGIMDEDAELDDTRDASFPEALRQIEDSAAPHHVILDCSSMSFVDTAGIAMLVDFVRDCLQKAGTQVYFAYCPRNVREQMRRNHTIVRGDLPDSSFFPTIHDAVLFSMASVRQSFEANSSSGTLATAKQ